MLIENIKIALLLEYEKNHRTHPPKQVDLLAKNIEKFGFTTPILVDDNNVIIAGHGRLLALKKLKKEEAPCVRMKGLTEDEVKTLRLADNQIALMGETDMKLVIEELKGLSAEMLDLTGFDKDLIIEPDDKDDEVPDVPEEPQSKIGDIYILGQHRVLCGDSTKIKDVERLMDGKKADMYLSDPPYNVDYEGKTKDALKIQNDKKTDGDFRQFLIDAFAGVDAFLKQGGVFYIWHADSEGYNFRGACHEVGWTVRQCLIWNKSSMVMGRQDYHWKHEPCLYGWKDGAGHLWATDRKQTTVLNFEIPSRNGEHPTMKPIELLAYQIQNNTKGEDIIIDNFLGSGSTLIASEKTGRICYGMELDPKYADVIVQRYCDYAGTNKIIKNGKQITWTKAEDQAK